MSALNHKIDFVVLISVTKANSNGDPLNGNRPRTDYNGYGEISDVCIKRKIRNRMQDLGGRVFVQSEDRCDDGFGSLSERASSVLKGIKDRKKYAEMACETWIDVRTFGQVFAFKDAKGLSVGVRGPVSIHQAVSVSPVIVESMQITKSVNGEKKESELAEKTCFSEEDAELVKKYLQTLFVNDASSARPDGSMEVLKGYWWKHNCKDGQYSSAKVHRLVEVKQKGDELPSCINDYEISLNSLPGLEVEVMDGV